MTLTGCGQVCQLQMQAGVIDIVVGVVVVSGLISAAHHGYRYFRKWWGGAGDR